MKPILYESTEAQFTSNGLGRLADCIDCTVTEERNGIYECQFAYPVTGEMFSEIREGRIIAVIHDDAKDIQPFDIYSHSAPLNGIVTFYAHHISYRLGNVILKPMEASSCAGALAAIHNNTYNSCPFAFWTDKAVSGNWKNKIPSAVKAILGGQEGSILDVYGKGEYQWDKWTVRLYTNRGNDNGVSIRYGVNLTDLQQDYDESGSYNAVAPYWANSEDGTVVTLTKGIVVVNGGTRLVSWTTQSGDEITDMAGNIINFEVYDSVTPVPMDLSDAFEEQPTEAQLEAEALRRLNNSEAWLPSENIKVEFVNLADTEEYRNVVALQRVSLCDKVSVYCGPLGVSAVKMQVSRVVYNVLTERYDEIELGKAKVSFAQTITAKIEEATKDLPTTSMMQRAINNATDKITGAMGGHVRFIYDANGEMQEILIMDADDINTAVKVWRWNSGGFGFSSHGYGGPYATAITQDGQIVADFITTGQINANLITVGNMIADIIKGGTLTLGGFNNQYGSLRQLDDSGVEKSTLNNNGFTNHGHQQSSIGYAHINIDKGRIAFTGDNALGNVGLYLYGQTFIIDNDIAQYCALQITTAGLIIFDNRLQKNVIWYDGSTLVVDCDFHVFGAKNRVVTTDQYSDRLLYCYETSTPMFGDIGDGVISDDGFCYVMLDAVFAQTVTTEQYQVFLQKYGPGDCWVRERRGAYFIVEGTPGMSFGWEVKAKQRDYDQLRLERNDEKFTVPTQTYGEDAAKHINDIQKERIPA